MDKALKIVATGKALPEYVLTNFELEKMVDTSDQWIKERTGIESRRICKEGQTAETLAIDAAREALERATAQDESFSKDKVGALIVATSSGDCFVPSVACRVQKALELPQEILAYDLVAACTGFVFSLKTAAALLESAGMEYALVIGTECLSSITDFTDRSTCILFGDGAGAAVVTLKASENAFVSKTWCDGNSKVLGAAHGGKIYMEGQEIFRFATKVICSTVNNLLDESGLGMENIDFVVCHQANARIIEYVKKKFKGHEDKFFMNVANLGNTSAASIPLALEEIQAKGQLKPGAKALLVGFGGGLTWGGALVEF